MADQDIARNALSAWYADKGKFAFVQPAGRRSGNVFLFRVATNKDKAGHVRPVKVTNGKATVGTPATRRHVTASGAEPVVLRPFGRQSTIVRKTHLAPRDLVSTGWTGTEEELADREG